MICSFCRAILFPCVIVLCSASWLPAQSETLATSRVADSASERDALFAEVAQEVEELQRQGSLLKKVVKLVRPSVVHLESAKFESIPGHYSGHPTVEEAGSGVVIQVDQDFYVLTNRHVILDAPLEYIKIRRADGRFLTAIKRWEDPDSDVAVIKVRETDLVGARLGDSDQVEIGDFVLAFGSPFGLSHSVSYGIISAKGRRDLELGSEVVRLQDFLQTDAAINPGNSGGPLLNLRGEVIGLNTAIASNSGGNEGVSFAIPIKLVTFVAQQMIARGEVTHAYLGVQLDNEFTFDKARRLGLNRARGALVKGIVPRSPAFFADLQIDDLIAEFGGVTVEDDDHLVNLVSLTPINETVTMQVIRKAKPMTMRVTVGNRRHFEPADQVTSE